MHSATVHQVNATHFVQFFKTSLRNLVNSLGSYTHKCIIANINNFSMETKDISQRSIRYKLYDNVIILCHNNAYT